MENQVSGQIVKFSEVRCRAINLGTIPQHVTQKAEKINAHVEGRPDASCRGPPYYSNFNFSVLLGSMNSSVVHKTLTSSKTRVLLPYSGIFAAFRSKV
jgi:hypothetical protein